MFNFFNILYNQFVLNIFRFGLTPYTLREDAFCHWWPFPFWSSICTDLPVDVVGLFTLFNFFIIFTLVFILGGNHVLDVIDVDNVLVVWQLLSIDNILRLISLSGD